MDLLAGTNGGTSLVMKILIASWHWKANGAGSCTTTDGTA